MLLPPLPGNGSTAMSHFFQGDTDSGAKGFVLSPVIHTLKCKMYQPQVWPEKRERIYGISRKDGDRSHRHFLIAADARVALKFCCYGKHYPVQQYSEDID